MPRRGCRAPARSVYHATSTLDATLIGTGTILYRGDPVVTMRTTGTGTVAAE